MPASNGQVQVYVDTRLRVRAEAVRALIAACTDDKASIDDVYAACVAQNPTWTDTRTDGPPHLLAPQDVLNYNAFISLLITVFAGTATTQDVANLHANWNVLSAACVRPVNG